MLLNARVSEHARLNDQAAGFMELMKGKIIHAPLENPTKILDVGCGTGIITRQLGLLYPSATIYGVDISPVPPPTESDAISSTPPNVRYITGEIRQLTNNDERLNAGYFDCVFQRLLVFGITYWQSYVSQMAGEKPETEKLGVNYARDLGPLVSENGLPGVTKSLGLKEPEMEQLKTECRLCLNGEDEKYLWFYVTIGRKE